MAQGEYIAPEKIEMIYNLSEPVAQIFVHGDSLQVRNWWLTGHTRLSLAEIAQHWSACHLWIFRHALWALSYPTQKLCLTGSRREGLKQPPLNSAITRWDFILQTYSTFNHWSIWSNPLDSLLLGCKAGYSGGYLEAGQRSRTQIFRTGICELRHLWQPKSLIFFLFIYLILIFFVGEGYHITPRDVLYSEWAADTHLKDQEGWTSELLQKADRKSVV